MIPTSASLASLRPSELDLLSLDNGLAIVLAPNSQAPLVTSSLWYRVGARDEVAGQGGIAHFLEHMMFKGSPALGPGEIDRRTRRLGGENNAFTSHDLTAYYFSFAADRWMEALALEADRMAGLLLDAREVESERRVILEELAMYDDDPWDALDREVQSALYGDHPYGKPVLGTAAELQAIGAPELAAFHRRFYRPDNAVLVIAGALGDRDEVLAEIDRHFGKIGANPVADDSGSSVPGRRDLPRPRISASIGEPTTRSVVRHKGELARFCFGTLVGDGSSPELPALRVLTALLGAGRASRLQRRLVDELELAAWIDTDFGETEGPARWSLSAELLPQVEPQRFEQAVRELFAELVSGAQPPTETELARCRKVLRADWVFSHERLERQALATGFEVALFEAGWMEGQLTLAEAVTAEDVSTVASRVLDLDAGVIGWSLPAQDQSEEEPFEGTEAVV